MVGGDVVVGDCLEGGRRLLPTEAPERSGSKEGVATLIVVVRQSEK